MDKTFPFFSCWKFIRIHCRGLHRFNTGTLKAKHTMSKTVSAGLERYQGEEPNFVQIESWLAGFTGGSVTLMKDENTGIAQICLNHEEKRNAMSGKMMVELGNAVRNLESWSEGKGVLLYGKGSMFCSGGDLDFARGSAGPEGGFKMACYMHSVLGRLKALPMVSAAYIHGRGAVGGGAELSLSCDWRIVAEDSRGLALVHSRMGIVPAWGATSRLASIVGSSRALDLICSGRFVGPQEALELGLANALVPDDVDAALKWLSGRTQADSQVIHAAKATILQYEEQSIRRAQAEERRLFAPLWGGPANQRALQSGIKHK